LSEECRGACDINRDSIDVDSSQHNGPPRCWYADFLRYTCLRINSMEQSLLLYSLQLEHHKSEEPQGPGPVCLCRTSATSTSCRSKFRTWPFLKRQLLLWCCIATGAHASTRKQRALQCPNSSTLPTGHFVRPRYCVVGHVAFSFGFCLLTNLYTCLCDSVSEQFGFSSIPILATQMHAKEFIPCL